jgi:CHAT domain-containing protein
VPRPSLLLADGELSLLDLGLSEETGTAPWLVLASACQSATVDVRRLPDEFVRLPTGFVASGVATFVGTLTTMRTIELMFPRDPTAKALSLARALQQARARLRNLTSADFIKFAANSPALREAARPSVQPYAVPSACAPTAFIGAGDPPTESPAASNEERRSDAGTA